MSIKSCLPITCVNLILYSQGLVLLLTRLSKIEIYAKSKFTQKRKLRYAIIFYLKKGKTAFKTISKHF